VIKKLNLQVNNNQILGLKGPNGSGKSTLLKIISGYLSPSLGDVSYVINNEEISRDDIFSHVSYAAPYIDGIPLLSVKELYTHYTKFKALKEVYTISQFYDFLELSNQKDKLLRDYSSGMQQKVQIGLSILSDTKILLLDEPSSYLDVNAKKWFQRVLKTYASDRIIIIASNDLDDFEHCTDILHIDDLQS
jgi:ABC-type multidrug transport system ATPase subunit